MENEIEGKKDEQQSAEEHAQENTPEQASDDNAKQETPEAPRTEASADDEADHAEEEAHEDAHEDDDEDIDFTGAPREELLKFVREAAAHPQGRNINKRVQQARAEFNRQLREARAEALEQWKGEGNEEADFSPQEDPMAQEFNQLFKTYKKRRQEHIADLNHQKDVNLQRKREILDKLKEITEQDETGSSFNEFKKLQEEWRTIGHVPITEAENLWNTYHFYVDKFYEQRSLYSEFKELDRKRNLTAKEDVINRITALDSMEDLNEVMRLLRQYQDEWRHIGPVPKENLDDIIQRYKEAVVKLYDKREKQSEELQKRREQNHEAKLALLEKIEEIAQFESNRVQDWISKNQELGQWIENWRSIGSVPVSKGGELKERFAAAIRNFNKNKNEFFRLRKKEKVDNLKTKISFCEKVEGILKEEGDLNTHRKEVIRLQEDWKKIGPVPSKYSDKVWKRFQEACDAFFGKLSEKYNKQNSEQKNNLEQKNAVIEKAEALAAQETIENPHKQIKELQQEFNAIGFVPFKEKDKVRKRFFAALNAIMAKARGTTAAEGQDTDSMSYQLMLENWSQEHGGDKRIDMERQKQSREMKRLENEIATLENNMEFLSRSKTADKLKAGLEKQIEKLRERMAEIDDKLKMIRNIR